MPRGRPKGSKNKRTLAVEAASAIMVAADAQPLDYLLGLMRDGEVTTDLRFRAAVAAAPYCHARLDKAVQSKKDEAVADARAAGVGKFATPPAPKLIVNNR